MYKGSSNYETMENLMTMKLNMEKIYYEIEVEDYLECIKDSTI